MLKNKWEIMGYFTCDLVVAGFVHLAFEELQANDGIDGDHKEDQK